MRDESIPNSDSKQKTKCKQLLNYKFMNSLMEPGEGVSKKRVVSLSFSKREMVSPLFLLPIVKGEQALK